MESPDTFIQLAIQIDPTTKALSTPHSHAAQLQRELSALNALHKSFLKDIDTSSTTGAIPTVPGPPVPVSAKRSAQITKLREAGNVSFKKGAHSDAIRLYTLAVEMALQRPVWEPWALVREELAALFANRAQAYMGLSDWSAGVVDARTSVEMKRAINVKAHYRQGVCLREMGRLADAKRVVAEGVEFENAVPGGHKAAEELAELLREIEGAERNKRTE